MTRFERSTETILASLSGVRLSEISAETKFIHEEVMAPSFLNDIRCSHLSCLVDDRCIWVSYDYILDYDRFRKSFRLLNFAVN